MNAAHASPVVMHVNRFFVLVYKVAGFVILSVILASLASYICTYLFFAVDRGWIQPFVVSATDENVLRLQATRTKYESELEELRATREALILQRDDAVSRQAVEEAMLAQFDVAVAQDVEAQQRAIETLGRVGARYEAAHAKAQASGLSDVDLSLERAEGLLFKHVIDEEGYLSRRARINGLTQAELSMHDKRADISLRLDTARRRLRDLVGVHETADAPSGYDVWLMKREAARSGVAARQAIHESHSLARHIEALDKSITQYENLVANIVQSPYLQAAEGMITAAFVPYANTARLAVGQSVYGCKLAFVWCERVGTIKSLFSSEMTVKHPLRREEIRGVVVHLDVRGDWRTESMLHLGHPLGLS